MRIFQTHKVGCFLGMGAKKTPFADQIGTKFALRFQVFSSSFLRRDVTLRAMHHHREIIAVTFLRKEEKGIGVHFFSFASLRFSTFPTRIMASQTKKYIPLRRKKEKGFKRAAYVH